MLEHTGRLMKEAERKVGPPPAEVSSSIKRAVPPKGIQSRRPFSSGREGAFFELTIGTTSGAEKLKLNEKLLSYLSQICDKIRAQLKSDTPDLVIAERIEKAAPFVVEPGETLLCNVLEDELNFMFISQGERLVCRMTVQELFDYLKSR